MNSFDLETSREVIMMVGWPATGKSLSIVRLALDNPDKKVMVIDRDRGVSKAVREVCKKPPTNLIYRLVKTWDDVLGCINESFDILGEGDWLAFDQIGRLWDLAQSEYSRMIYGEELTNHILTLRAEVEKVIRAADLGTKSREATSARARDTGFQGLEGRYDWPLIKRMHNDDVFDRVILDGNFNVLSTNSLSPLTDDDLKKKRYPMWQNIQARPEGEKHQVYRHDTIAVAYKTDGGYFWRTDLGGGEGKDRGRPLARDVDFTNTGFVRSYLEYHSEEDF